MPRDQVSNYLEQPCCLRQGPFTRGLLTSWDTLDIGFCKGWPDDEVAPSVDDHPVAGSLVQDPQFASPGHYILHTSIAVHVEHAS